MKRKQVESQRACPHCGGGIRWMASERPAAPFIEYAPPPKLPKSERMIDGVDIPFRHGVNVGGPIGSIIAILCALSNIGTPRSVGWGAVAALTTFLPVYAFSALGDWNQLWWRLEQLANFDFTQDGAIGEPSPQIDAIATDITVKERADNGKLRRIITLNWPCGKDDIPAIAQRLLDGRLAQADWGKGTLLSVPKFKTVVASLIKAGYGKWNNPADHTKGWHLTVAGRVFLGEKPPAYPAR